MEKMMKIATNIRIHVVRCAFWGFFFTHCTHRQQEARNRITKMKATGAAPHKIKDCWVRKQTIRVHNTILIHSYVMGTYFIAIVY